MAQTRRWRHGVRFASAVSSASRRPITNGSWISVAASAPEPGEPAGQTRPILPVDPPAHLDPERLLQRGEPGGQHAHVPQVDLEVLQPGGADEREGQPHDLDVRRESAVAEQLGAHLQRLPGAAAALGLLPVDLARVAEPERQWSAGEGGGGDPRDAGGEVEAEGENPAVAVGEPQQALGHPGAAGAEEDVLVLEGGRKQLLVAGALEHLHRAALQRAAAAGGVTGEIDRAGGCGRGDVEHYPSASAMAWRTRSASCCAVNGFSSSAPPAGRAPCRSTASSA